MKRDMAVVREILLKAEGIDESVRRRSVFTLPGRSDQEVAQYLEMMEEAGLIEANLLRTEVSGPSEGRLDRITWWGHDFLDSIRDESVWSKVKARTATVGGRVSFEMLKALATQVMREQLGLSDG